MTAFASRGQEDYGLRYLRYINFQLRRIFYHYVDITPVKMKLMQHFTEKKTLLVETPAMGQCYFKSSVDKSAFELSVMQEIQWCKQPTSVENHFFCFLRVTT